MHKKIGRYLVTITNPEKSLLKDIVKGDIIDYYENIADVMVPYLKNRPLMMHRFPEGLNGESFYQKDASSYFPDWIKQVAVPKTGGFNHFVICQNKATLVYLANQACITPHLWLSRTDKLNIPDRVIFDLDPSGDDFETVRHLALAIKELLTTIGLISFVMTSGSRGLHIYIPLKRSLDFSQTREFATLCAQFIIQHYPDHATLELRKEKRGDKVFIDTLRNQYGATSVAPYAVRARPHAPVATPLDWKEVEDSNLHPQKYTIHSIFKRLSNDPWHSFFTTRQSLTKPFAHIKKLGP